MKAFMMWWVMGFMAVLLIGCAHVSVEKKSDGSRVTQIDTFATDMEAKDVTIKTETVIDGVPVVDNITIKGYGRNETKGTKILADTAMGIAGAVAGGISGGPIGAAGGAAGGVGVSELIQRYLDGLKSSPSTKIEIPSTTAVTNEIQTVPVPVTTTNALKPMANPPYTDEGLKAAGNSEECPQTKAGAGVIRLAVRKATGGVWLIGHLLDQAYDIVNQNGTSGTAIAKDIHADGGTYVFVGWSRDINTVEHPCPSGTVFPYSWVTFICYEFHPD